MLYHESVDSNTVLYIVALIGQKSLQKVQYVSVSNRIILDPHRKKASICCNRKQSDPLSCHNILIFVFHILKIHLLTLLPDLI